MVITVDWPNRIINVPRSELFATQLVPQEIRRLDLDAFRKELRALEADEFGRAEPTTHAHVAPLDLGGVIQARSVLLQNGYTVTFEDGQYAVNIEGGNTNLAALTNVNSVSVRPNNSVGLQDLSSLQAASYQGRVTYDADNGFVGTTFPIGTEGFPSSSLDDLFSIAQARGIKRVQLFSDLALDRGVTDFTFFGATAKDASTFDFGGNEVDQCRFENLTLTGMGAGSFQADHCTLTSLAFAFLTGDLFTCGLQDAILITTTGDLKAIDCYSEIPGAVTPSVEIGTTGSLQFRRYAGGIEIRGHEPGNVASFDFSSAHLILHPSCTGGDMVARGPFHVTRNDGGAVNLITQGQTGLQESLGVVNEGVKRASRLRRHTQDLP